MLLAPIVEELGDVCCRSGRMNRSYPEDSPLRAVLWIRTANMAQRTSADPENEGALVDAAKTISKAAGELAAPAGLTKVEHTSPKESVVRGRFLKKNKSRLPRRQKKALQKKAGLQGS